MIYQKLSQIQGHKFIANFFHKKDEKDVPTSVTLIFTPDNDEVI